MVGMCSALKSESLTWCADKCNENKDVANQRALRRHSNSDVECVTVLGFAKPGKRSGGSAMSGDCRTM